MAEPAWDTGRDPPSNAGGTQPSPGEEVSEHGRQQSTSNPRADRSSALTNAIEASATTELQLERSAGPHDGSGNLDEATTELGAQRTRHKFELREELQAARVARVRLETVRTYCFAAAYLLAVLASLVGLARTAGYGLAMPPRVGLSLVAAGPVGAIALMWTDQTTHRRRAKGRHRR